MRISNNRAVLIIATLLLAVNFSSYAAAPSAIKTKARTLIEGFHGKLLDVMKNAESLGIAGRFARLQPEVARRFDIPLMMALTTGKYWREANAADRKRLVDAFERFSAATYASRFSGFSGQSFETIGIQPGPRRTQLVQTRINRPDDTPVAITYVTRATRTAWQIVDVLVDNGISELAIRRSEYRSILNNGGVDGLVRLLDSRTKSLLMR